MCVASQIKKSHRGTPHLHRQPAGAGRAGAGTKTPSGKPISPEGKFFGGSKPGGGGCDIPPRGRCVPFKCVKISLSPPSYAAQYFIPEALKDPRLCAHMSGRGRQCLARQGQGPPGDTRERSSSTSTCSMTAGSPRANRQSPETAKPHPQTCQK